jgi:hypothetical protein
MLTRASHWALFWIIWIQPTHLCKIYFNMILPPNLCIRSDSFIQVFHIYFFPVRATCPNPLNYPNNIWRGAYIMELLIMQFSSACYFFPLSSRHFHSTLFYSYLFSNK